VSVPYGVEVVLVTVSNIVACAVPLVTISMIVAEGVTVWVRLTVDVTHVVRVVAYTGFLIYAAHNS
jgi:hypothetical protein